MSRRVLVVHCHPVTDSFTAAMRDRAIGALHARGHDVRVRDLYDEGFRPELSAQERAGHKLLPADQPGWREIEGHAADLRWCDTLTLIYPTWWSGLPAMLKGWVDRVWVNGVAWTLPPGASRIRPQLRNIRRIVVITAHGSPRRVNLVEGEAGRKLVFRQLRVLCHPLTRCTWIALYDIDRATAEQRSAFLARIERRLRRW